MKLAFVAGSASACSWFHHHHHHHEPFYGLLKQADHCPKSDAKKLDNLEAHREFFKAGYTGWTKGWYQANEDIVSDQCFGDWIDPIIHKAKAVGHKYH